MGLREECKGKYEQGVCKILPDEAGVTEYVAVISFPSSIGPTYQPIILRKVPAQKGFFEISAIVEEYETTPEKAFKAGYKYL